MIAIAVGASVGFVVLLLVFFVVYKVMKTGAEAAGKQAGAEVGKGAANDIKEIGRKLSHIVTDGAPQLQNIPALVPAK